LRVYALDPSVGKSLDSIAVNETTFAIIDSRFFSFSALKRHDRLIVVVVWARAQPGPVQIPEGIPAIVKNVAVLPAEYAKQLLLMLVDIDREFLG
jgi:hypothetical protein